MDESGPGNCHHAWASCCIQICNDLPKKIPLDTTGEVVTHLSTEVRGLEAGEEPAPGRTE